MKKEHECQRCERFMSKDALSAHTHDEEQPEVVVSVESCAEEDGAPPLPIGEPAEHVRSNTRTPSFSPPYMRPSARRSSFSVDASKSWTPVRTAGKDGSGSENDSHCATACSAQHESPSTGGPAPAPLPSSIACHTAGVLSHQTRCVSLPLPLADSQPLQPSKKRQASPPTDPTYTCSICSRNFTRRTLRDNHLRTHTNERPFACSYDGCTQAFKQKNEQTRHEQTKHRSKKFVCGGEDDGGRRWGCGKAFARSDGLLEHQTKTVKGRECVREKDAG